ncbi:MAG TPA: carboxylesterase family protein [Bryobacteraceae bacterium]|nr:carboxylesterase family protein [Bryobacteraceae bacterium]
MAADSPTVALATGRLRGSLLDGGGAVFKGIPFAEAPVGNLRWRPPVPAKPWSGTRDATSYASPCAQNAGGSMLRGSSEDCLYLNVWTPQWPPNSPMPVMFWIHGGGNYAGTASTGNFDGQSLARHGVVVVTANYRLGVFGFFAHPELTRESPHHSSGNYGLMDQILALEWVRDNIAKFGGDAKNVTAFGQSAGAVDANVLTTSPLAKGLFQRVIAESGTVTRNPDALTLSMTALGAVMKVKEGPVEYSDAPDLAEAERAGKKLGASIAALREMPAEALLRSVAGPRMAIGPANGIVVDGWVLPKPPAEVYAKGEELPVPLLIGNNARERTPPDTNPGDLAKAAEAMYGALAQRAANLYNFQDALEPDPLYGGAAAQWVVDTMYRCPVVAQSVWHAAAGNTAYEYQFDLPARGRESLGSVHGAEVPYVFGRMGDDPASKAIQQYWTNFAKSGNPNGPGLPQWPKFENVARGYLEFTANGPVPGKGLRRPFCDLYVENVKRLMGR